MCTPSGKKHLTGYQPCLLWPCDHSGSQLLSHQAILNWSLNVENSFFTLSFLCSSLLISSQPPLGAVQVLTDSRSIYNHIFLTSLKISRGKKGITGRQSNWVGTGVSWKVRALIKGQLLLSLRCGKL